MRRLMVILLVLMLAAGSALADGQLTVTTGEDVQAIKLMDEVGQTISKVENWQVSQGMATWVMTVRPGTGETAALYVQDGSGSWTNTGIQYAMSMFGQAEYVEEEKAVQWEPWPYQAQTMSVVELPSDSRYQSRSGPSGSYHGAGGYKTYKMTRIEAFFVENGYVYTDLSYSSVGRRMLYLPRKAFHSLRGLPDVILTGETAYTTEKLTPRFGPGSIYDDFPEAKIGAGTSISVFFEKDGWLFAEFDSNIGPVRAWINARQVER